MSNTGFVIQGASSGFGVKREINGKIAVFFDGSAAGSLISVTSVVDGMWHHIVAQSNGTNTFLYIDNVLDGSQVETLYHIPSANSAARLYFGTTIANNTADKLTGQVDELRLFSTALTLPNIAQLYLYGNSAVSIKEFSNSEVLIYPNPATATLTIKTTEKFESVSIYNLTGSLIQTESKNNFSVEQLSTGVYVLKIKTASGYKVIPMIHNK